MKTIGIVCEGPTDQIIIKSIIDKLTGEENRYYKLQPEETLAEKIENPWENIISKRKTYHNVRVRGSRKNQLIFTDFAKVVSENWSDVTAICESARNFEQDICHLITQV